MSTTPNQALIERHRDINTDYDWWESSEYARDAITDLMAQCVECSIYRRDEA